MLFYLLDLFGVAVFAISGALVAMRRSMDVLGVIVIATVTATGGGTLRDVLLDRHPIFWLTDPAYPFVIIASATAVLVYSRFREPPGSSLLIADAFGLALFTVSGAQIAEQANLPAISVVLLATMTGVAGGVLRDILCAEIPLVLRRDIYATASIAGAAVYLVLKQTALPIAGITLIAMVAVFALRLAAIVWGLHLPRFDLKPGRPLIRPARGPPNLRSPARSRNVQQMEQ